MRHVRILSLFISSILPKSSLVQLQQRKTLSTCNHCGKMQSTFRSYTLHNTMATAYRNTLATTTIAPHVFKHKYTTDTHPTTKKYANKHGRSRPAEPSIAIRKLSLLKRPEEALSVYLQLLTEGGFPSREALYQLTRALYKSENLSGMYTIHDTLLSYYNQKPPSKRSSRAMIYMFTMLIHLITKTTRPVDMDTITQLCQEMKRFHSGPNIVLYNTLIQTLLDQDQLTSAKALLKELKQHQVQPTIITYTIFMKHASKRKDIESIMTYLDAIEQDPAIDPDYATTSVLVSTLCTLTEFDRAREMVDKLYNTATVNNIIGTKYRTQLLRYIEKKRKLHGKKSFSE